MAWKLDTAHSLVEFSVRHMMITTVRGRFTKFDGTITADPKNPLAASIEGWIDAASVDTHETDRDNHLRSPDFFDVAQFPRLTFRSKRIEKAGSDTYRLIGDLTIKNTTREIAFEVTDGGQNKDPWGNLRWGLTASTTLNRKDFGLTWNVALETGGWLVGDQVKINTEMELIYVPETEKVPA